MRRLGPSARFVSAVTALIVLGIALPVSAGQAATELPGVAADDGDQSSESSADPGTTRVRRTVRSPIRDPWSAGVRVLWSSVGGGPGGGVALPPTAGGSPPVVLGSCSASGSCAPHSSRLAGGAPGAATTGNGFPVQGVAFDAGRLVMSGVEVGIGLDLTTHPGQTLMSTVPGVGFRTAAPEDTALQVLTGERALQLDLAARLTYRSRGSDAVVRGAPLARPYVGIGAGMSRYFPGFSTIGAPGFNDVPLPPSGAAHLAFDPWIPNFQVYGGFLVSFARMAPMLDVDIRYMRAANRGLDLGGFRFGTGIRYPF